MLNRTCFDFLDLEGIAKFMEKGFTFQETMRLLENNKNKAIFQSIQLRLEQGEELDTFFADYCPKSFKALLQGFLKCLDLKESIALCVSIIKEENANRKTYEKELIYPLLLCPAVYAGLVLFHLFCFPVLIQMLESFHADTAAYLAMQKALRIGLLLVGGIVLIGLFLIGFMVVTHKEVEFYRFGERVLPSNLYTRWISIRFVRFFLQCLYGGLPTSKTLSILSALSYQPVICYLAKGMNRQLTKGKDFEAVWSLVCMDSLLIRYVQIAFPTDTMQELLEAYLSEANRRFKQKIQRLVKGFQLLSYSIIGVLLILVYQVLMAPMEILTQL